MLAPIWSEAYHDPLVWVPRVTGRYGVIRIQIVDGVTGREHQISHASKTVAHIYIARKGMRVMIVEDNHGAMLSNLPGLLPGPGPREV